MDDVPDIAAERNTSVFPSMRLVREKIDLDDDADDDDEGSCFKSRPAALRHAAHIIFLSASILFQSKRARIYDARVVLKRSSCENACVFVLCEEHFMTEFNRREIFFT